MPSYMSQERNEYVPFVDLSATFAEKSDTLYLHVVNRHESETADLRVAFRGFKPRKGVQLYVAGESIEDRNTLNEANRVRIEEATVKIEKGEVLASLGPHSINVIKISA